MKYEIGDTVSFMINDSPMLGVVVYHEQPYSTDTLAVETDYGLYPMGAIRAPCNATLLECWMDALLKL